MSGHKIREPLNTAKIYYTFSGNLNEICCHIDVSSSEVTLYFNSKMHPFFSFTHNLLWSKLHLHQSNVTKDFFYCRVLEHFAALRCEK